MTTDGRIRITLIMDGTRVDGEIDGQKFAITRKGCETRLEGIQCDDAVLGSIIASKLLTSLGDVMDGLNILTDETDDCKVWERMPDDVADEVYEAIG